MVGPNWTLDDDLKTVTISFPSNPPVALKLDATAVDDILRNLGEFRAMMVPEVSRDRSLADKFEAIPDPMWTLSVEALQNLPVLHLRDPRYGWLRYLLPPQEAKHIAELLLKQIAELPPTPPKGKAN